MSVKLYSFAARLSRATRPATMAGVARSQRWAGLLIVITLTLGLLAACGDSPTPVPPTPTPTPKYQQENNFDLLFTMNIPFNWNKNVVDANTVVYQNPADANEQVGIISKAVDKLTPESQALLQDRTNQVKSKFPGLREDVGSDSINLVASTIKVNRLSYSSNGADLIQYLTEFNNVGAQRAYVLFGITNAKTADTNRPLYLDAFRSFISTAADKGGNASSITDPTVVAGFNGGKVVLRSGQEQKGVYLTLVAWETPPLDLAQKAPRITGYFPKNYSWRIRPYPVEGLTPPTTPTATATSGASATVAAKGAIPAVYLESPVVDRTTAQAVMQFGVVKDAIPSSSPSADDWKKFYTPVLNLLQNSTLSSYGSVANIEPPAALNASNGATIYRAPFSIKSADGAVNSRGIILFSRSGTHGVVSVLSLSPAASIQQSLVDNFDTDFQTMVTSFTVKY